MTGIHDDISAANYHADLMPCDADGPALPSLSASIINVLLNQSPAHARACHPRLNPDFKPTDEDKFDMGTVCHSLLLENTSIVDICDFPDWRTKLAKEARELARSHGRIPLLTHQYNDVIGMYDAVARQIEQLDVDPVPLTVGKAEQTLTWVEDGVACRARLDWLHDDFSAIDDLKTTSRSANPEAWSRGALFDHGCDVQAALYLRGLRAIPNISAAPIEPQWRWLVVETNPPYALSIIQPSAAVLALGDAKIDKALGIWRTCLETDVWPAFGTTAHTAELPPWIESRWLEREARAEVNA